MESTAERRAERGMRQEGRVQRTNEERTIEMIQGRPITGRISLRRLLLIRAKSITRSQRGGETTNKLRRTFTRMIKLEELWNPIGRETNPNNNLRLNQKISLSLNSPARVLQILVKIAFLQGLIAERMLREEIKSLK